MTFRPGPLRASAALAVGFVVVRVMYRLLFHGMDGKGVVLLPLPEWRLAPPFAHVELLGTVTLGGLGATLAGALPIAATILAFGALNTVVDLPRLFVRFARRGPLSGVSRAAAIAWATLPSLADAARSVRFAQRLRGERGGIVGGARMLAPLLQRTLERAARVATTLELRGFAGRALPGDCLAPLATDDLELGFGDAPGSPHLRVGSLALHPSSLVLLSGPTGSGKSTMLRAIAGLHETSDGGWMSGALHVTGHDRRAVPPRDLSRVVGVVLQYPRTAFVTEHVRDEIGLALELRGVDRVIIGARVAEVAERIGVTALLGRSTRELSAGEAMLVAIAAAVVEHPILLLVDEPFTDLDASARTRIAGLLDDLAHRAGMCVIVAEHRLDALASRADLHMRIDDGRLVEAARGGVTSPAAPERGRPARDGRVLLLADGITVRHRTVTAVDGASLALSAGEIVALVGENGAGKSSLLSALALPSRGTLVEAPGRVTLVPDASDDLFVTDTVARECARADRRAKSRGTAERFAAFLGLDPRSETFATRAARHPLDLSVGERRCLAIALQLATSPSVLLVDEPTRGLDPVANEIVATALVSLADAGAAVLVATHEPEIAEIADRVLTMSDGRITGPATPEHRAPTARRASTAVSPPVATQSAREAAAETPRGPAAEPSSPTARTELRHRGGDGASGRDGGDDGSAYPGPAFWTGEGGDHAPGRLLDRGRRASVGMAADRRPSTAVALTVANLVALGAFCWPLVAHALPPQAGAAVPFIAVAVVPLAALAVVATLDRTVRSAHLLALLGTLAAIGAVVRVASTGVGGVEAVFVLLILAGRAYGARFALLLGVLTIALSSLVWGAVGPWTPFQMFACAWVGAGAGLLPRLRSTRLEIGMLCLYGVAASYLFGLIMNLWFWPFAVGGGTGISYDPDAPLGINLSSFLLYSLITSTAGWDTLRAITTVVGLVAVGRPVLAALRRAKPLAAASAPSADQPPVTPRSTSPRGGGTRTRRSTARGAAAAPR